MANPLSRMLERAGLKKRKCSPRDFRMMRATLLGRLGIDLVVDLGANVGQYGTQLRSFGYRGRILSVEPLPEAYATLAMAAKADGNWETVQSAVGSEEGVLELNVAMGNRCSSLLKPTARFQEVLTTSQIVATERVRVRRLDDLLREHSRLTERLYLKADVQGFEVEIMKGGGEALQRAAAVEVELSLESCYQGAPSSFEVMRVLNDHGLQLVNVSKVLEDPGVGRMLQIDGIFERM